MSKVKTYEYRSRLNEITVPALDGGPQKAAVFEHVYGAADWPIQEAGPPRDVTTYDHDDLPGLAMVTPPNSDDGTLPQRVYHYAYVYDPLHQSRGSLGSRRQ